MQVFLRSDIKVNLMPHVITVGIPGASKQAVMELANYVAERERFYVPVRTGLLLSTIHVEEIGEGAAVISGSNEAYYGPYQEYGTSFHAPHPFVRPAADDGAAYSLSLSGFSGEALIS